MMKDRSGARTPAELLPSFFVLGPPRTGTSWIHEVLAKRAILPNRLKETRFFDQHFSRGFDWYLGNFPASAYPLLSRGEVAPTYFASCEARRRIAHTIPSAKAVCMFRNPLERMVSHYRVRRAYGLIRCNFEEALLRDQEMIESARYATHLKAWQQALGEKQILPTLYEQLSHDPQRYFDTVANFLGIQRFTLGSLEVGRVHSSEKLTLPRIYGLTSVGSSVADWLKSRGLGQFAVRVRRSPVGSLLLGSGRQFENLPAEVGRTAFELVRNEIEELQSLLNCDLSGWDPIACNRQSTSTAA